MHRHSHNFLLRVDVCFHFCSQTLKPPSLHGAGKWSPMPSGLKTPLGTQLVLTQNLPTHEARAHRGLSPELRSALQWCQQQKAAWGARSMIYFLPYDLPFCHYFSCPSSQPLPIARCLAPTSGMKPSGLCFRKAVMKVSNLPCVFGNLEFLSFVSKDLEGGSS